MSPPEGCILDSSVVENKNLPGFHNTLIILASDLNRIPEWIYQGNPLIEIVQVLPMDKEERRQFALRSLRPTDTFDGFYEGDRISIRKPRSGEPSELELLADELADLTENFRTVDLEALRLTSWQARIPLKVKEVRRLVDFFKFGRRDDPWEQLKPEKVKRAANELSKVVIGQPKAIEAITAMLTSARVGLSMSNSSGYNTQPKGVFFFVGPTGVGKTELAKALTKLVFGDEQAFARFDMSEYKEEHAAEKLAGAPPGFVGYEEGGQLTNRVLRQPYSILLFDEIEKAHPRVLDKFLQILEDGRLTDGKGQTAYFNQTVIIFTSNIGASDLTDSQTGILIREGIMSKVLKQQNKHMPTYEEVEKHFSMEVQWYFNTRISRSELLGRFIDSIVVFDLLRPDFINLIAKKFLQQLSNTAQNKYNLNLIFSPSVIEMVNNKMQEDNNLLFGGRRIKSIVRTLVEKPLNKWIFENFSDLTRLERKTLKIEIAPQGFLRVSQI